MRHLRFSRATPLPSPPPQGGREHTKFAVRAGEIAWRLLPALPFALVLIIWIAGGAIFHPNKATLPPVTDVIDAVWTRIADGELLKHVLASLWRLFLGAALGIVTGVLGGFIADNYLGKYKTIVQMVGLSMMLYRNPLLGLPVYELGLVLTVIAAVLTLLSMIMYLKASWPTLKAAE